MALLLDRRGGCGGTRLDRRGSRLTTVRRTVVVIFCVLGAIASSAAPAGAAGSEPTQEFGDGSEGDAFADSSLHGAILDPELPGLDLVVAASLQHLSTSDLADVEQRIPQRVQDFRMVAKFADSFWVTDLVVTDTEARALSYLGSLDSLESGSPTASVVLDRTTGAAVAWLDGVGTTYYTPEEAAAMSFPGYPTSSSQAQAPCDGCNAASVATGISAQVLRQGCALLLAAPEPIVTKNTCIAISIGYGVFSVGVKIYCALEGCTPNLPSTPPDAMGLMSVVCHATTTRRCDTKIQVASHTSSVKIWAQTIYWTYLDGGGPSGTGGTTASIAETFSLNGYGSGQRSSTSHTLLKVVASPGGSEYNTVYDLTANSRHSIVRCTDAAKISTTVQFYNGSFVSTGFTTYPRVPAVC